MKNKSGTKMRRLLTWDEVTKILAVRGWMLLKDERTKKIWFRGNEKLRTFRTFENEWKAEYFVGRRLIDSTGESDEFFARVITLELGVSK